VLLVLPLAPGVPAAAAADATVLSLMLLPAVCSRLSCMPLLGPATGVKSLAASSDARLLNLPSSAAPAAAWLGCGTSPYAVPAASLSIMHVQLTVLYNCMLNVTYLSG
jgi:hypothetical protein